MPYDQVTDFLHGAKGGGFILEGAASIPDEARPENVMAMAQSVRKYAG